MSFKVYVYYCALFGGWAAFAAWVMLLIGGWPGSLGPRGSAVVLGIALGSCVAAGVGFIDGLLNAVGVDRLFRPALCAMLGGLGGLIGALVGQVLFDLGAPRFLGWMLAGALIGASFGAFDLLRAIFGGQDTRASLRKVINGVLGGVLGGLVGGLMFSLFFGMQALPRSSLTIGLVGLGASIGVLVGLAHVILKEAWIKVEEGFRPGRELLLTKDETVIGREEGCDLGLFGDMTVARKHARVLLKNNRYLLSAVSEEDPPRLNGQPVGNNPAPLSSGDRIQVGKYVLVFGERQKRNTRQARTGRG